MSPTGTDPLRLAKITDSAAYVANNKLVALFPGMNLPLAVGLSSLGTFNLNLALNDASLVCDVVAASVSAGVAFTNCVLSGRWKADAFLHQLSHLADPAPPAGRTFGSPVCADSPLYANFKKEICESIDIFNSVPTEPVVCDGLSVGFAFRAAPALLGDVYFSAPWSARCSPDIEPSNDSCAGPTSPTL